MFPRVRSLGRVALLLCFAASGLAAQSLQLGRLQGAVRDSTGAAISGAEIRVIERSSGAGSRTVTTRDGSFRFAALPEGRYDFAVEALGYLPVLYRDLRVSTGPLAQLDVTLRVAASTVTFVDTVPRRGSSGDAGQWLIERGYGDLVGLRRNGVDLTAFSTTADARSIEGLPWRFAGAQVDGANASFLSAPSGIGADAAGLSLPVRALATASVGGLGYDAEVSGSGFGLRGTTRRGGRLPGTTSLIEGGSGNAGAFALASGPLQGDTAQAVIGGDYQRFERDVVAALPGDAPRVDERASVFTRFDWHASDRLVISARALGSRYTSVGVPQREGISAAYGRDYEAIAGQAALNIYGQLTQRFSHEWRLSTDFGTVNGDVRDEPRADIASVVTRRGRLANDRIDEARTTPRLSGMVHADFGTHRLKAGFAAAAHRLDSRFVRDADGWYAFGEEGATDALGAWRRVESNAAAGEYRMSESALFIQDAWQLADGLSIVLGARMDRSRIPVGDIEPNSAWAAATALDNTNVVRERSDVSPRVGLRWALGRDASWVIEGGAGIYNDLPDARDVAEALTLDRGADVRYGVGLLPVNAVPSELQAPVVGSTLTMLAPTFTGPKTQRLSLGVSHRIGEWNALVSGVFRHTDFLTRRRDLNLPASPIGRDQFGRPLYGGVDLQGSALVATPQSNRRFSEFDAVHLLESTGFSEFWGITAGVERVRERGLSMIAQYTFSRTTDNVPGFEGTRISPFPDGLDGRDWAEGRSDFDVPHRLLLALDWRPNALVTAGVVYRLRSGLPFTPGLRRGVDANGDGDWTNDPAFVDASLPGLDAVLADNDCVKASTAGFVARNSCREEIAHGLDLRLAVQIARTNFGSIAVVIDALDVIAPPAGALDRALLLVDPTGSLSTDATTGVTTIPFVTNPNFGERTTATSPGVFWRLGLRITP